MGEATTGEVSIQIGTHDGGTEATQRTHIDEPCTSLEPTDGLFLPRGCLRIEDLLQRPEVGSL